MQKADRMFFVCQSCNDWSSDRPVVDGFVECDCGSRRPILLLPMFVLTGASAAGKSTVGNELLGSQNDPIVLDADMLWVPEMDTPEDGYARFRSMWLRLSSNIHQAGHSTLLIGSGVPEQYDSRPERAYVGPMHWMALVCDDDVLEARLRARPAWRGVTNAFVKAMLAFNAGLRNRTDIQIIDTSQLDVAETVVRVKEWLREP
jgi:hypothetical protein